MSELFEIDDSGKLSLEEREILEQAFEKYNKKIIRLVKKLECIKVKVRLTHENQDKKKYSLSLLVFLRTRNFESDSSGWSLHEAITDSFEKILNEIEHAYHISETHHAYRKDKNNEK